MYRNFEHVSKTDLDREMLKFSLSLHNNRFLSDQAIDTILVDMDKFISDKYIPYIQTQLQNELQDRLTPQQNNTIQLIMENSKHIFSSFSTQDRRFSEYAKKSFFVHPDKFSLGLAEIFNESTGRQEETEVFASYIPLTDSFKMLLEKSGVYEKMKNNRDKLLKEKDVLSNIVQGEVWQKKYYDPKKDSYPLLIFCDDFEVRNPLGSHAGEECMCGIYVSLPCLPPELVATLDYILLSTICHTKYVKMFGNEFVFSRIISDLNVLSKSEIFLNLSSGPQKIFFDCVLLAGDNKGLNSACGFVESFKSNYYCRLCYASSEECSKMVSEISQKLRCENRYDLDLKINDVTKTGLKERCVFNKINKFHIYDNVSVDVMHDLWEGVAAYDLSKILDSLIKEGILKLDTVNSRINSFPYNDSEKRDKPRSLYYEFSKKGAPKLKIRQSSAECLCLTRYLGLMIGDLVPRKNKYWKLYLYLRRICDIVTSPRLHWSETNELRELIQKHNKLYVELFDILKPKMHFLVHYPGVIRKYGPLVHFSAHVFERKNKIMKDHASSTSNNLFLPLTISKKHQLQFCYTLDFCPVKNEVDLGPKHRLTDAYAVLRKLSAYIPENSDVFELTYIEIFNKKYKTGSVIVTGADVTPYFAIIKKIYLINNATFFQIHNFKTESFDPHVHAWEVSYNDSDPDHLIHDFPKNPPCQFFETSTCVYVTTRYKI